MWTPSRTISKELSKFSDLFYETRVWVADALVKLMSDAAAWRSFSAEELFWKIS